MPTSATRVGSSFGSSPPTAVSSFGPKPNSAASGIPWMLPEGEVFGTWMSLCASTQRRPSRFLCFRQYDATPEIVPMAIEWSPPSTSGNRLRSQIRSTALLSRLEARAISPRYRARRLPMGISSMFLMSRSPPSTTRWPRAARAEATPAIRSADGPMSTPRRPEPRSMGTPSSSIFIRLRYP